jgi:hypothetical protein
MRRTLLCTAAFGAALISCATAGSAGQADRDSVLAQAQGSAPQATSPQGTNLGNPLTQPQPGGGVATGAGAPTSALPAAEGPLQGRGAPAPAGGAPTSALPAAPGSAPVDAATTQGRGPPPPGSATPAPHGTVTGSSQLGPTGAITPGAQGGEAGTGGGASDSNRP